MQNPILQIGFDFFHLMATIAWIGGMFFNFLVVMPTIGKTLDPATAGKFMKALFKRVRVIVYISLAVLFITGIPMKIASDYYSGIISFDTNWNVILFVKHVFVGILALMAIYNFEILGPKIGKLAAKGPSPELISLRGRGKLFGAVSFLVGIITIFLSAMMNYL